MIQNKVKLEEFPPPGDRYCLEDLLGSGAFGKVFTAADSKASNKTVAVKIQKLNENTKPYIEQEYKILRDLSSHANLPDFYGIYRKDDDIWFVMEICEGGPILDIVEGLLAQNRRMSEEHIAYVLKETVKTVTFLHEKCIIHRDIKAKNILLTRDGEVKLIDFGFSWSMDNILDKTDGCLGSPCWMAPEIITCRRNRQTYDNRIDVWSLGITAIELRGGKPPYHSMHLTRTLFQIVANPPPTFYRTFNWSENYVDFINECLVKNPEHRPYASELIEHPFLAQIPENNYHLTLEMKALIKDVSKLDLPKAEPEVAVVENLSKCGVEGSFELMLVEDLASLDHISEKNVINLLEERVKNEQFYTFAGDVLLVLNSNEKRDHFGEVYHEKYHLKSRSENSPHIYAIADSTYQHALHHQIPQRILLSGESGSGKTKNYLHLINHLLFLGQNRNINLERIKEAIKLIHSLTHASTPVNGYSTRCVFKTNIKYGSTGKVSGAIFNVYQLEKWRVSSVDMFQGNYHFLYYIYDGLCEMKKLEQYHLNPDRQYRYLRIDDQAKTTSPKYNIGQNVSKFKKILKIFENFEMSEEEINVVFSIVAALLIVGEIRFEELESGIFIENVDYVEKVGQLLKIDPKKLGWSLTNYCFLRKGTVVRRQSSIDEARDARDVFANNLYSRLVDYLVSLVNHKLAVGIMIFGEKYSIQVFDFFGFECVKSNHLPELFVNCFNEQLQYHYVQRVFSWEYLDINEEELEYQPFGYYDNRKTLDQLLNKSDGLFSVIDEASKTGNTGEYVINFLESTERQFISTAEKSEFVVAHYTGKVTYCATEMPDKNRDFLPPEIIETLRLSDDPTIKMLFTNKLNKTGNLIISFDKENEINRRRYKFQAEKSSSQYSQVRKMRTCIHTFKALSLEILKELSIGSDSGGTHFVRCIRTSLKGEDDFDYRLVKQQIRALAVTETAKARQRGYPHRIPFQEFLRRYQFLAFDFNENVEVNKENCRLLLIRLKMEGWNIGKSKVFLKYYNEECLARLYETHVRKIIKIQSILRRFLAKCLVEKQMSDKERVYISRLGKSKPHRMSEEEAAAIIQRAYRESNIRKSYHDFAKDYEILDEETCDFIRSYADRWRKNSLFHVLVLYRAKNFQDMFNFSQQVHFYNIAIFYELQKINEDVSLDVVDSKAQVSNWLEEPKLAVRRLPFRLDEIPFYDTSDMCSSLLNPGVSMERDETWDLPYRWRELVSSKSIEAEDLTRNEENLINLPYTRDPATAAEDLPDIDYEKEEKENKQIAKIVVEEFVSNGNEDDEAVCKNISEKAINVLDNSGNLEKEKEELMVEKEETKKEDKKVESTNPQINEELKIELKSPQKSQTNKIDDHTKQAINVPDNSRNLEKEKEELMIEKEETKKEDKEVEPTNPQINEERKIELKIPQKSQTNKIDDHTKLANKDFDYIRPSLKSKPKSVDPIAELRQIGPKNASDDEPPFNFQGMLRKTNFKKDPPKENDDIAPIYSLKKRQDKVGDEKSIRDKNSRNSEEETNKEGMNKPKVADDVDIEEKACKEKSNTVKDKNRKNVEAEECGDEVNEIIEEKKFTERRVVFELAPGVIVDGIEVEL